MGVRNKKRETLRRLDSKTLDARFLNEIRNGLNCSPFEAEAVLELVKEVYFPFLDEQPLENCLLEERRAYLNQSCHLYLLCRLSICCGVAQRQ